MEHGIFAVRDKYEKDIQEGKRILIQYSKEGQSPIQSYMTKQDCINYILRGYTVCKA